MPEPGLPSGRSLTSQAAWSPSKATRGAAPDPGPPSGMAVEPVIPSPGQAKALRLNLRAAQGLATLGLRQTLARPGEPGVAHGVPDRGDGIASTTEQQLLLTIELSFKRHNNCAKSLKYRLRIFEQLIDIEVTARPHENILGLSALRWSTYCRHGESQGSVKMFQSIAHVSKIAPSRIKDFDRHLELRLVTRRYLTPVFRRSQKSSHHYDKKVHISHSSHMLEEPTLGGN